MAHAAAHQLLLNNSAIFWPIGKCSFYFSVTNFYSQVLRELEKVAMMKTGPNDTSCVVWAKSMYFLFSSHFFNNFHFIEFLFIIYNDGEDLDGQQAKGMCFFIYFMFYLF